jgi:hypothetical protein
METQGIPSAQAFLAAHHGPLGTLHILTQELRDEVWSLALSDTTIIWGAITKTKSIALLSSSKTIRKEVVPTIIRTRCITLQTPAALSLLLRSCKTEEKSSANQREEADTPRSDKVEAPDANKSHTPDLSETDKPHLPSVPKKKEQQHYPRYRFPRHIKIHIRIARERGDLQDKLTAWQTALAAFPTGGLHSLSFSFKVINPYWYYSTGLLVMLLRFMGRLTIGVQIKSRGRCCLRLEGEHEVVEQLRRGI